MSKGVGKLASGKVYLEIYIKAGSKGGGCDPGCWNRGWLSCYRLPPPPNTAHIHWEELGTCLTSGGTFWASFLFSFLMATPTAYGSSPARDWIQGTTVTHTSAVAMPDLLTHCAGLEIGPGPPSKPSHCRQILNPLCYRGNSSLHLKSPWSLNLGVPFPCIIEGQGMGGKLRWGKGFKVAMNWVLFTY